MTTYIDVHDDAGRDGLDTTVRTYAHDHETAHGTPRATVKLRLNNAEDIVTIYTSSPDVLRKCKEAFAAAETALNRARGEAARAAATTANEAVLAHERASLAAGHSVPDGHV